MNAREKAQRLSAKSAELRRKSAEVVAQAKKASKTSKELIKDLRRSKAHAASSGQ